MFKVLQDKNDSLSERNSRILEERNDFKQRASEGEQAYSTLVKEQEMQIQ